MTIDVTKEGRELRWHIGANLRWLADLGYRPTHMPCGELTGAFLIKVADQLEARPSPSALSVGEEDALTAWVTKIALEGDIAAKDGLEFGDLVRAFRAGFRAAIAAMNGGGE